jgi:hypothetical protein
MKKLILLSMVGLLVIMFAGLAQAACTITAPTIMRGVVQIRVTCPTIQNVSNCTLSGSSALTGDTIATFTIFNSSGTAATNQSANRSLTTNTELDASDWILAGGLCYNMSNAATEAITSTTVTIDNFVPTTATALTPATGTRYDDPNQKYSIAFSSTCVNATAATLYIDGYAHTMVEASDVCSYTKDFLDDQVHNWYIISNDGLNYSTATATQTLEINTPGGAASRHAAAQTAQGTGTQALFGGSSTGGANSNTMLLVGVGILAYLMFFKKKK